MPDRAHVTPLIAVTASEFHDVVPGLPVRYACSAAYLQAVHDAGGTPVLLSPFTRADALRELLRIADGLLVTGGPDLHPARYGHPVHPNTVLAPGADLADELELQALNIADQLDLPTLCICRGMQALNVMRGGTLHQHLPDVDDATVDHGGGNSQTATSHPVTVTPGTVAAAILGDGPVHTNSFHHQAVDRIGAGLHATGHTCDRVIEIVEDPARSLLIGVQWHPETMNEEGHRRLFSHLTSQTHRLW